MGSTSIALGARRIARAVIFPNTESLGVQFPQPGRNWKFRLANGKENSMLLILIIIVVLLFAGGGGYYGYSRWGTGGGLGIVGTVILILVILYFLGALHR